MSEAGVKRAILVNGNPFATEAATLADLVVERGLSGARIATARNGDFVPERARGGNDAQGRRPHRNRIAPARGLS